MQHVFWLMPGVLAGRSGPSKEPWRLEELKHHGIAAVLSVNDGAFCHPAEFERAGLLHRCLPLSPNAPPEPGDLEHCISVLRDAGNYVADNEKQGRATLVHCHSGKDRTALFMAYYLTRRLHLQPAQAVARVKAVRPIAFTAPGWDDFAREVLAASATDASRR